MSFIKRGYILTLLALLAAPQVFAANISFLVAETGLREDSPVNESSSLWETGLLDVFFDAGHIVSNAPIMSLTETPNQELPDEVRGNMEEALRGGADFFVLALLDYHGSTAAASKISPQRVSLRLFKMSPYQFLYEQVYVPRGQEALGNELVKVKELVRFLIPHLDAADE
ncbi:MAG: hypothetical protein LBL19_04045 [Spirochaetaceae bacterium]|jgi:hypothetical protein|nr:hypothetical protein [Spirochaetaceae bacterium]